MFYFFFSFSRITYFSVFFSIFFFDCFQSFFRFFSIFFFDFFQFFQTFFKPPRTFDISTRSRYTPDTYPTHTRYICIPHEYSPNTPRMSREYSTHKTAMREATLSTPDSPLVPLLAVLCTAVVRRVFHASVRMVRQLSFGLFHFHSSVFENVCTVKNILFCSFLLRV